MDLASSRDGRDEEEHPEDERVQRRKRRKVAVDVREGKDRDEEGGVKKHAKRAEIEDVERSPTKTRKRKSRSDEGEGEDDDDDGQAAAKKTKNKTTKNSKAVSSRPRLKQKKA